MIRRTLAAFLLLQAALSFYQLDLLPMWGDENHTLQNVLPPWSGELCTSDVHPPLYFLIGRGWVRLGLPGGPLLALRALSVLFLLLSTWLIDRWWLRDLGPRQRLLFLALWTLSPCLILYGRMARSYTLQMAVFLGVMRAAERLLRDPTAPRARWVYAASNAVLLYLHYIPGLAMLGATGIVLLWRRRIRAALVSGTTCAALFAPWIICLSHATGIVAGKEVYRIVPNWLADQAVRLAYWFVSFFYGETMPVWVMVAGALIAPVLLYLVIDGFRRRTEWAAILPAAALLGYIGIGQWAAFAFVPARMLFLLPFALLLLVEGRRQRLRLAAGVVLLCMSAGSLASYYRSEDFLNKGYLLPYLEIAALIEKTGGVVLLEMGGMDQGPFASRSWPAGVELASSREGFTAALRRRPGAAGWQIRTPRAPALDLPGYRVEVRKWVPYSAIDAAIMKAAGWRDRPTHLIEAAEFRPMLQ